jgi:hypothetical protein
LKNFLKMEIVAPLHRSQETKHLSLPYPHESESTMLM